MVRAGRGQGYLARHRLATRAHELVERKRSVEND